MRFDIKVFHTLPARGSGGRVIGELPLSTSFKPRACAYATHSSAAGRTFYLRCTGKDAVCLTDGIYIVDAVLIKLELWSTGFGRRLPRRLVATSWTALSSPGAFVSKGLQRIPLAGCAEWQPRAWPQRRC